MGFAIPLAITGLVGAGVSAYGAYESGQAGAASSAYQAQVARNNAAIAKQNAAWTTQAGNIATTNASLRARAAVGGQKAAQAAGGVDVNTGSAADVRNATAMLGRLDALTTQSDAARKAYGYQVAGVSDEAQAQLDAMQGKQAAQAGTIGALGSLLGSASTVGANYAKFKDA